MSAHSFTKILIANRGEIAVRIMRTCRRMGIASVAVYSSADARAPHVQFADEAVFIGPAPVQESYLNAEKIIAAALRTDAEAVHPGYGFLSENAEFAGACAASGLVFIGPSPESIRSMGLKSTARRMMAEAGVPIVPGYDGDDQELESLRRNALAVGLPILIKASAGGGGKGMRLVRDAAELANSLESARREAERAFGDGSLLIEKYIGDARHVEFQVFGDNYGKVIHLFERDCSIQRRHQKVIEESPSPAMTLELRRRMGEAALRAAAELRYSGAGTVEFLLAPSGEFYFIEVNTRLQVEHPVTEMITGLDLVELQIRVAEGNALPLAQDELQQSGHAIEARLYAEDPDNDFLPASGRIAAWHQPESTAGLRIDSGVETGTEVGIYYDPLLAKVIAHGPDRDTALRKLIYELKDLDVQGVKTNRDFLIRLLSQSDFQSGLYSTSFIDAHRGELAAPYGTHQDRIAATAATLYIEKSRAANAPILSSIPQNFRNNPHRDPSIKLQAGGNAFNLSYRQIQGEAGTDAYLVYSDDWREEAQVVSFNPGSIRLAIGGVHRQFRVTESGETFFVHCLEFSREVIRLPRYPVPEISAEQADASAPMPGQVLKVLVTPGQQVSAGDPLIILEAMKMEQTLKAAMDGFVEAVLVGPGDIVAPGDSLVHIAAHHTDKK
ncbi:MAG TPA: acetyl-CoA carboxylase biotin carboxylase subunit [Blastocatellia bacterium]|nr:acetyl-CoA carboxylase biotin carboxylase subunit [Blastocatellia bacterium]